MLANASVQAGLISALESNAAVQSANIAILETDRDTLASIISNLNSYISSVESTSTSNAAVQAGLISDLRTDLNLLSVTSNVVLQESRLQWIEANVVVLKSNISVLESNIAALFANAAGQAGDISTLQSQVYTNANVANYLPSYTGELSSNVTVNTYQLGYRVVPQVSSGNITLELSDSGKHYYSTTSGLEDIIVPSHANVALPIGTEIQFILNGSGTITLSPQPEVTLHISGNNVPGTRFISSYGHATIIKVEENVWFSSGTGLS